MKKSQIITLVVLVVVLGACIAGYFVGKQYFADKEKKEEAAKTTTALKIDTSKVTGVAYSYNGKTFTIGKVGDIWTNVDDSKMKLNQMDVGTMIGTLRNIKADTVIENPKDISQYGFTKTKNGIKPKTQEIYVKTGSDKYYDIFVGSPNPYNQSAYYVMIKGDNNVYLVDGGFTAEFSKTLNELEQESATADVNQ
ncbi:MAG: DUF4340 domain-containing protein [Eubacterium sp.]|nr:DUF4340 domain-containing protein [Eubacterium sp.]